MFERKLEPLYSNKSMNDKIFKNVKYDELSKELIEKSPYGTRHAVVGWVPRGNVQDPIEIRTRPGLHTNATQADIAEAKVRFGENMFVISRDPSTAAGTGLVHEQTLQQVIAKEPHLESGYSHIGLSFNIIKDRDKPIYLQWLNRSAKNMSTFEVNPFALACLTFDENTDLDRPLQYSVGYHLLRSMPSAEFNDILSATEKELNIKCSFDKDACYSFEKEDLWNEILAMENIDKQRERIKSLLLTNIYIAAAVSPYSTKDPSKNGFEKDLRKIISIARQYDSQIDLNEVPPQYKVITGNATALIMAAERGHTRIAEILVQSEVDINKKDDNGNTAIIVAARDGHFNIVKNLIDKNAIYDSKELSECLNLGLEKQLKSKTDASVINLLDFFGAQFGSLVESHPDDFKSSMSVLYEIFENFVINSELDDAARVLSFLQKHFPDEVNAISPETLLYTTIKTNNMRLDNNIQPYQFIVRNFPNIQVDIKSLAKLKDEKLQLEIVKCTMLQGFVAESFTYKGKDITILSKPSQAHDEAKSNLAARSRSLSDNIVGTQAFTMFQPSAHHRRHSYNPLQNTISKPVSAESSVTTNKLNNYIAHCTLISSQITPNNENQGSLRNKAIEALYDFAKEAKTTEDLNKQIHFFVELDSFIKDLPSDMKEKCLFAYGEFANTLVSGESKTQREINEALKEIVGAEAWFGITPRPG